MEAKHTSSVALPETGLRAVILINGSLWGGGEARREGAELGGRPLSGTALGREL